MVVITLCLNSINPSKGSGVLKCRQVIFLISCRKAVIRAEYGSYRSLGNSRQQAGCELFGGISMIRLLLVDDQSLICQGFKAMLELEPDLEVVGMAENGEAAIEQVAALQPDFVLMDVRMPVMDGRAATRAICQQFPNIKVIVLSTFDDDEYISDSIRAGAKGYLLKDMLSEELVQAIQLAHRGYRAPQLKEPFSTRHLC